MLAGTSGSTGQTGASGQTGLTGRFGLSLAIAMSASMSDFERAALRRGGIELNVRHCDCLQGQAAPQARPGPLGRRVSQVGSDSGFPLRCMQAWQAVRALHRNGMPVSQCKES